MNNKPTIFSVQMLRGLAAILVVIAHAQVHLHVRGLVPALNPFLDIGRAGVDIFFIISGFIMVFISGNKFAKNNAARDFLIKRLIRVVPTYWVYTCVLAVLMLLLPHVLSQGKEVGLSHLIASMLF